MELLIDLFDRSKSPGINETQFSGLHMDGITWRQIATTAQLSDICSEVIAERERVLHEQGAGLSARSVSVVALRYAPEDNSAYGNTPSWLRAANIMNDVILSESVVCS